MRELEEVALAFDRACRKAGVPYAFIGGIAVLAWGQPRTTMDVDALVRFERSQADALVAAAADEGLQVSADDLADALSDRSHVTVADTGSALHVDMKFAVSDEERAEIENAVDVDLGSGRLRIVAAEDTVAFKLKFGSEQDLADARSILARQEGKLDVGRLETLCVRLGVQDRLAEVRRDVENG